MPYSTWELEAWSVVQLIVADVAVTPPELTALMTGVGNGVENARFDEVAVPAESVEMTA